MQLSNKITDLQFLIVDDFASITMMLTNSLNKMGIKKIQSANSGNAAYKIIEGQIGKPNEIQFVISDFNMPNGTGLDLVKAIRANSALKKLPMLLLTSQAEIEVVLECVQAGVNDYMIKPWQDEELKKKLISLVP